MPRTSELRAELSNMSFLLVGDSGTEKTRMASTFPEPLIYDFDKGTASITRDVEYRTFKDAPKGGKAMPAHGIYPWGTGWQEFIKDLNKVGEQIDKGECPFKTIVLDSATTMASLAMNFALKAGSRDIMGITIKDWGSQMALLETVFDQLTSWPLIKVVTAHIQRTENTLTENTEQLPLMTGKLAGKMSIYFDEVYFTNSTTEGAGADKKRKVKLITQSSATIKQAKSRFGVPDGTEPTWEAVSAAIKKNARVAA